MIAAPDQDEDQVRYRLVARNIASDYARDKVAKLCGQKVAQALVDGNPRAIIGDKPLPYFPNPAMKKSSR